LTRIAVFLLYTAVATAAAAQPASDVSQIAGQSPAVDVGTPPAARTTEAPAQISNDAESTAAEAQLTSARASHQQTTQLSSGAPSAQASEPLSRPSEGRTAAVERVGGTDRCDPAVAKEKQSSECKKVIETRADEYQRPSPTELSPEQKLLLAQRWGPGAADAAEAANRLAKSGSPDNSMDSLGVASIVLNQRAPADQEPEKKEDPAVDSATQAIIQLITQTPPQN
jgi:hypothetical protein